MSNIAAKVASGNGHLGKEEQEDGPQGVRPRARNRPYKPQMATKVKWVIVDSRKKTEDAHRQMRLMIEWIAELRKLNSLDMRVLAHLGKLDHIVANLALDIADVDRLLSHAIAESKSE